MRQQGDSIFIDLLNNVKVEAVSETDVSLISSRSCATNNLSPPVEALYFFAENSFKGSFSKERILKLNYPILKYQALVKIPQMFANQSLQ